MGFEEALKLLKEGKRVTRKCWTNSCETQLYVYMKKDSVLRMKSALADDIVDVVPIAWIVSTDWIEADDIVAWEDVIKSKSLCWFWDDELGKKDIGFLEEISKNAIHKFNREGVSYYKYCKPVKMSEINFAESHNSLSKYIVDDKKISKEFSELQIESIMSKLNLTRLQTVIYLWAFNHFNTNEKEVTEQHGNAMYKKLALSMSRMFEERNEKI